VVTIRASSRDEGAAFVAALAVADEATDGGALLARTALVDDPETSRRLRDHASPLVLVALTEAVAEEFTPGSPHVLVVPLSGTADADIKLPPIDSLTATTVLKSAGLPEREAENAGRLARLSLLASRRRLANKRELHEPEWGQSPAPRTVRRVLLLGGWHELADGDREIVVEVTGTPYDTLREELAELAAGGDPLVARVGGALAVVSPLDAYFVLRAEIRVDDLESFATAVRTVLSEQDPRLELPRDERWRASILGKHRGYSTDLRNGLATTLALLGAHGGEALTGAAVTGREYAAGLGRELLSEANLDPSCRAWESLADVLPLLAEAAPSEFLDAVRAGTSGETPVLSGIFGDTDSEDGGLFSSDSAHPSLLWALETCGWSPDHFGQVIDLLARLSELDPGGRLGNRPFESLMSILLPWFPQNSVSVEGRLAAIDGLRANHPPIAWRLLLALLPEMHGASGHIAEPVFRDWKPERISVPMPEYLRYVDEIYRRVLEDVVHDPKRWVAVIDRIDDISGSARLETLGRLSDVSDDIGFPELRNQLWEALREKIARHREFPHAEWALPGDVVEVLETVAARFEPSAPIDRRGWLFREHAPEIPDVQRGENFEEYERALADLRAEAAAEILDSCEWEDVKGFVRSLDAPWFIGEALAQAKRFEHECELLELLGSDDKIDETFASGYVSRRFVEAGWEWLDPLVQDGLTPRQVARLLVLTRDRPKAWEVADELGNEVADSFWREFRTHGLGDFQYVGLAATRLMAVGRPGAALDLIALYSRRPDGIADELVEFVADALGALLAHPNQAAEMRSLSRYELIQLFAALNASALPRERLAQLEWAYLPLFGIDARPAALAEMLSEEPAFFVDLIRQVYTRPNADAGEGEGDGGEEEQPSDGEAERRQAMATNSYRLLSEWRRIPGLRTDGTVDPEQLEAWVTAARAALAESGHRALGDSHIGRMLAAGPADEDGSRPGVAVRDLLERLQNSEIEDGLRMELYNSRGPTTRGVFDGGDQERNLAATYRERANAFADRWPRAASIMRDLANSYEREARRMDEEAERRRRGLGP
jgi:hypothetical protein